MILIFCECETKGAWQLYRVNPVIPLSGVGAYVYNASGELIRLEATEGSTIFSRGELGVINSVTLPSSQSSSYKTDYNARRVEKLNSTSQNYRRIYQNQLQVAAELKGTELSEFIYATRINIPELVKKSGQTYRVITDHMGSPVLVINTADGTIESQAQYNEWGRVVEESNAGFIPFSFAGGLRDLDTGLVRFGARDYSPQTARWISKDPIGFNGGDANLYRYANNNPVNFVDPSGNVSLLVPVAIAALVRTGFSIKIIYEQTNMILRLNSQIAGLDSSIKALQEERGRLDVECDSSEINRLLTRELALLGLLSAYQNERNSIQRLRTRTVAQALLLTALPLEASTAYEVADAVIKSLID